MMFECWSALRCRFVPLDSQRMHESALSGLEENASLLISWPFAHQREQELSCSVDRSPEALWHTLDTALLSTTQPLTMVSSHTSDQVDANSNGLVVAVVRVVSRFRHQPVHNKLHQPLFRTKEPTEKFV